MNKTLLRLGAAAIVGITAIAMPAETSALSTTDGTLLRASTTPLAFARTTEPKGVLKAQAEANLNTLRARIAPNVSLAKSNEAGYLDGPDGETWYFTVQYDIEKIEHEYYTENAVRGYEYTIYDSELKVVGTVKDKITLGPDETKVSSVSLDPAISKKFFNVDDKCEIVVAIAVARTDNSIHSYSRAYSIGAKADTEGNTPVLTQLEGYIVDVIDAATDRWAEKLLITFMTETSANIDDMPADAEWIDYLATFKTVLTTYRSSFNAGPTLMNVFEIPMLNMPGDGIATPFFFSKKAADDKVYFTVQQYEKSFFVDPSGIGGNEEITPDNSLIIQNYVYPSSSASALTALTKTVIPTTQMTESGYLCSYYSVGSMLGTPDIDFEVHGTPERPAYFISVQNYTTLSDENYTTMYYLYDNEGNRKATLAEYCEGVIGLSDVKGAGKQAMFIQEDIENYIFKFVDLSTCQEVLNIPSVYNGYPLTVNMDRRAVEDSYEYVIETTQNHANENGETIVNIIHVSPDGTIAKVDNLNVGKKVAYAKFFISAMALSPYVFNTDSNMEYMALVKRYIDAEGTTTREELMVVADGQTEPLLTVLPDESKGALTMVTLLGSKPEMKIMVIYVDEETMYTQDLYKLPLKSFEGGAGTAEDPYRIATVGDLQAIAGNPKASYAVVNDFDAVNFEFIPIKDFRGVLDGRGHTIKNLTLGASVGSVGLFAEATGVEVRNLTFDGVTVNLEGGNRYSGVIAGVINGTYKAGATGDTQTPDGAVIDDVHIYNLTVNGANFVDDFGALAGRATLGTTITRSLVKDADIRLPHAPAGGIVGQLLTGSSVRSSAFNGVLNGGIEIGGIASSAAKDCVLANCHVTGVIYGDNTIGGILGVSSRAKVENSIFQGQIQACKANKWTRAIAVGGIIGALNAPASDARDADDVIVRGNVVDMSWLGIPELPATEEWPGQHSTVHRIVGWTRVNDENDENDVLEADKGLADNYAIDGFRPVDASIAVDGKTTEGADIDRYHFDDIFLGGLGFAHGTTKESPWSLVAGAPKLYFENVIMIETPEVRANSLTSPFNVPVLVVSRVPVSETELMSDLTLDFDATHFERTGNYTYDGKKLNIEFRPLKEGLSYLKVKALGSTAGTRVYTGAAGVDNIVVDGDADAQPEYFDLRGIRVDNPTAGQILIERRGTKVTKVIFE